MTCLRGRCQHAQQYTYVFIFSKEATLEIVTMAVYSGYGPQCQRHQSGALVIFPLILTNKSKHPG